jgi:hypothetical protein
MANEVLPMKTDRIVSHPAEEPVRQGRGRAGGDALQHAVT